jgi:hypothetical protein
LDVEVSMAGDAPGACQVTAVTTRLWEPVNTDRFEMLTGRLVAERIDPPAAAAGLAGCTAPKPAPPSDVLELDSDNPGFYWNPMTEELGWYDIREVRGEQFGLAWPEYVDPRLPALQLAGVTSGQRVDQHLREWADLQPVVGSDLTPFWWTALSLLLASPVSDSASRAAGLRAAAGRDEAVLMPELTADVTGRSGVTLRVPYHAHIQDWTADLTFDVRTGGLLQQAVHIDSAVYITTFLAMRRL